jgi:hypothetical protein
VTRRSAVTRLRPVAVIHAARMRRATHAAKAQPRLDFSYFQNHGIMRGCQAIDQGIASAGHTRPTAHASVRQAHHGERSRRAANSLLGLDLLSAGGAGGADRPRHGVALRSGGRRSVARPPCSGTGLSARRPPDRLAWRASGAGLGRRVDCTRPRNRRHGAEPVALLRRLDRDRRRHGRGPLRCSLCDARNDLRQGGAWADLQPHAVRRLCQHSVLAVQRLPRRNRRLAQHLPCLRRDPPRRCRAAMPRGTAARPADAGE